MIVQVAFGPRPFRNMLCLSCEGTGDCHACHGTNRCRYCGGNGKNPNPVTWMYDVAEPVEVGDLVWVPPNTFYPVGPQIATVVKLGPKEEPVQGITLAVRWDEDRNDLLVGEYTRKVTRLPVRNENLDDVEVPF